MVFRMLIILAFCPSLWAYVVSPGVRRASVGALYGDSFALVIGVGNYKDSGWNKLDGACRDLIRVRGALESHGFKVTTLFDPTRTMFEEAFLEFVSRYGQNKEHRLLLYYAGHGYTIKGDAGQPKGFLVPVDAPSAAQDIEPENGCVSMAWLLREAKTRIKAKHSLFLFDSCFSGAIFNNRSGMSNPGHRTDLEIMASKDVQQFIASGTDEQSVPDNSVFAGLFVDALEGKTELGKDDGFFTASRLGLWLHAQTFRLSGGNQSPQYGKDRATDGEFIFKIPKPEKKIQKPSGVYQSPYVGNPIYKLKTRHRRAHPLGRDLRIDIVLQPLLEHKEIGERLLKEGKVTVKFFAGLRPYDVVRKQGVFTVLIPKNDLRTGALGYQALVYIDGCKKCEEKAGTIEVRASPPAR